MNLVISENIDFSTVNALRLKGEKCIEENSTVIFDFQAVTHANSAGLTLMLCWLRRAKQQGKVLHFVNVPATLKIMADMCNVKEILRIK